jgi:MFS family permease
MSPPLGGGAGDGVAWRLLAGSLLASTVVVLPAIMLGAVAVLVREELGFGEAALGLAVALFAASSTLTSVPGGRLAERVGASRTMTAGALLSGAGLLAIATTVTSWGGLVACLVVAGVGNGLTQPATNGVLSGVVNPARQGIAFGVKQAAIPLAGLLSGITLPLLGLRVGWRWAFGAGAVLALVVAVLVVRARALLRAGGERAPQPADGADHAPRRPLLIITVAAGLASMAANAVGAFYVESSVDAGVPQAAAGWWLAVGGATGMAARTFWGWLADRRDGRHLVFVAWLMAVGALGLVVLALRPAAGLPLAVGTLLTYSASWGWPGLFNYAIVRQSRAEPSAATGVTQAGLFSGQLIGPPLFGWLVERTSYGLAWGTFAGLLVLGAGLLRFGRWRLLAERAAART